jgi:tetratricopeptide (TPR) repeat protein
MEEKTRVITILADEFTKSQPLAEKLREAGFRVEVVEHTQATCDMLAQFGPDIIITDSDEKNTANPFHLITGIREDERLKKAEIFFYSTSIDVKTEIILRKLKIISYFIKSDNVGYIVDAATAHFHTVETPQNVRYGEETRDSGPQDLDTASEDDSPGAEGRGFESSDEFTNMFADIGGDRGGDREKGENQFGKSYSLGISLYEKDDYEKAIDEFEKASQSPAWRLKSLLMMGMTYKKMGEFEKALAAFKTGYRDSADESGKAEFLYELGDALDMMGNRMEEAYKMFAAVYQRNKEFRDVRSRLISLKSAIEAKNKA